MMNFSQLPIHKKLMLIIMSVTISTLLIASTVLLIYDINQMKNDASNELTNTARLLGNRSSAALIFEDQSLAKENLLALQELPHINFGCIFQADGFLFANYFAKNRVLNQCPENPDIYESQVMFTTDFVHLMFPIKDNLKTIGYIYLNSDLDSITQRINQHIYLNIGLLIFIGLLAFLLSRKLQQFILKPLNDVANVAMLIEKKKDYSRRAPMNYTDEIGQFGQAFNAMLDTIESQNKELLESKNNLEILVKNRTLELESANRELESFSYSVSHDLKAPLRSITGFSQVIQQDYADILDDEGKDLLNRVVGNTRRMSELIDDLLELSRLGRKELEIQSVDFDTLTQGVTKSFLDRYPDRKVDINFQRLGNVMADPGLIKIVMENLLGNAWKYTSKKPHASIKIGKYLENGETVFFVEDDGAGFDMQYSDKLFGAFQRLHKPQEFEGTGIGLATVQRIVKRHGGRVWANSELNQGTTFCFTIGNK